MSVVILLILALRSKYHWCLIKCVPSVTTEYCMKGTEADRTKATTYSSF